MATIVNKILEGEAEGDNFGHSVSISEDGSVIAISAPSNEGELTEFEFIAYGINLKNDTSLFYQTGGSDDWTTTLGTLDLYSLFLPDAVDVETYSWSKRSDLSVVPNTNTASSPMIDVVEIKNLSNGGKNIYGVIFDNNDGISGQIYSTEYLGRVWDYKDDITYVIEDTNSNLTLDNSDQILSELNYGNNYSDFGGLSPDGGDYDSSIYAGDHFPILQKQGLDPGSVKVFKTDGKDWIQLGNEIIGDSFWDQIGISISLSADGTTLAVGSPLSVEYDSSESDISAAFPGRPYVSVYKLENNIWNQIGSDIEYVETNDQDKNSYFGFSTSLSADGKVLAVSSMWTNEDVNTSNNGEVKIFENSGIGFSQVGNTLKESNFDEFGYSVDLSSDGSTLVVSSAEGGGIFIYERDGDNWSQIGETISFFDYESDLKPETIRKQETIIQSKITDDGRYIAIGSPNTDDNGLNSGKLKVFKNNNGSWEQVGADIYGASLSRLGTYIDIEVDSNGFLTLGASGTDENGNSFVNVYKLFGSDWISFANLDSTNNKNFPTNSLDISNNGEFLAIGTSHSPINNQNYDDNYLSAGYIGFKEEIGNVRVYDLSIGLEVASVNKDYSADSKGFSSISGSAPVTVTSYEIGKETTLDSIKDYDGNLHAGDNLATTASSYKYQGMLDVNGDGVFETIFTNKSSKRWVTAKVDLFTGQIDFDDNGAGGGTRVVGIYEDPLIAEGSNNGGFLSDGVTPAPANFGVSDVDRYVEVNGETIDRLALNSQVRFQNDLEIDNLQAKHSGDYDSDGIHEVYWKTADGTAYLRSLMHADGNIRYANYQSEAQMKEYLTANGDDSVITDITS